MASDMIEHFIGIDGGGSGCRVAITDASGTILGEGRGGPANATTDMKATLANLQDALNDAVEEAGLSSEQLARARGHAGLARLMGS